MKTLARTTLALTAAAVTSLHASPGAAAPWPWGGGFGSDLRGTMCWVLDPVVGKETFLELNFTPIGNGHSLFSGTAVRQDASHGERVLQMSGSASKNTFTPHNGGDEKTRYLMDLHYSFNKVDNDASNLFSLTGAALRGHYAVDLDPENLNGVFQGNDIVIDWNASDGTPMALTGPINTFGVDTPSNDYSNLIGVNNYLGGIDCDVFDPGSGSIQLNCGTVLPLNNAGTLTLVGDNRRDCRQASPFN